MTQIDQPPVLIGYDGSEAARAAIAHAGSLLAGRRAVVACVWAPVEVSARAAAIGAPGSVALAGARQLDAAALERAELLAEQGAELAREAGLDAEAKAIRRDGPPWRALVACAASLDAAAIVTGTRGRSRTVSALLGSTAAGVLRHAQRPVLVVP